jgi:hypothetical protein
VAGFQTVPKRSAVLAELANQATGFGLVAELVQAAE